MARYVVGAYRDRPDGPLHYQVRVLGTTHKSRMDAYDSLNCECIRVAEFDAHGAREAAGKAAGLWGVTSGGVK